MTQRKEYDHGLMEVRASLVAMGEKVQWALDEAIEALKTLNVERAEEVITRDKEINQLELHVEEKCANLILKQQPVAKDLRTILAALRIASDLERMGDLSVDIARVVLRLEGQTLIKPLLDLPRMADTVRKMTRDALIAFVKEDVVLAEEMAHEDDTVDGLFGQILRELFSIMIDQPRTVGQAMQLCFVGRYIERIADHATNIGESVIFMVKNQHKELN